jgi:phosphoribosyl 1,2-cyclic phosphodiesterase
MKFEQIASGSTANAYVLTLTNGRRILLECGLTWNKLEEALNFDLSNILCCLLTHNHQDHCRAAVKLIQNGIPIYSTLKTLQALNVHETRNAFAIPKMREQYLLDFSFMAFPIEHDAVDPVGFIVREFTTNEYMLFVTDTAYIKYRFKHQFSIIAIECSYDKNTLTSFVEDGKINETLARRLLDTHMEISTVIKYLKKLDLKKCREIHLIHCSDTNISTQKAKKRIYDELFVEVVTK